MPISKAVLQELAAFAAVAMLAGCSGGDPPMAAVQQGLQTERLANDVLPSTWMKPQTATHSFFNPIGSGKPLVFESESSNVVNIFRQADGNRKMGEIVGDLYGASGLATDGVGDVYVANSLSGTVAVFAPPYTKVPKRILDDTGNNPVDVAVSTRGLVAVANFNPSVSFFRANSTKRCATVSDASFGGIVHDAFDDKGNLYVDGENGSGFVVGAIRGGCNATTIERLSTGNVIGSFPGAIKVDGRDRVAIEDAYGQAIYAYNPPVNGSLGNPVTTTPLPDTSGGYNFAFAASGRALYVADYLSDAIEKYAYPAGGSAEDTISVGDTRGVAVTPPLVP